MRCPLALLVSGLKQSKRLQPLLIRSPLDPLASLLHSFGCSLTPLDRSSCPARRRRSPRASRGLLVTSFGWDLVIPEGWPAVLEMGRACTALSCGLRGKREVFWRKPSCCACLWLCVPQRGPRKTRPSSQGLIRNTSAKPTRRGGCSRQWHCGNPRNVCWGWRTCCR